MAIVTLSSAQKEQLLNDESFKAQVKWGILDKASYWAGHDGSSPPGGLERWRRTKSFALLIKETPSQVEGQDNVKLFLEYIKNIACVDTTVSPWTPASTIAYLLDNGVGLNNFDVMADAWFDAKVARTL